MTKQFFGVLGLVILITASCSGSGIATSARDAGADAGSTSVTPASDGSERARIATAVVIGDTSACAIVSGSVYCWGSVTSNINQLTPLRVDGLKTPATAISGGSSKNCALVGGEAFCWVANGQVTKVAGLPSGVTAISVGYGSDCAVAGGKAYCWGSNNLGQLGDGSMADSTAPVQVQGVPGEIVGIGAGEYFTCALADGNVYCWGENTQGQLGDGTPVNTMGPVAYSTVPVKVQNLPPGVSAIAAGMIYACALADGAIYCWGYNSEGQLGDGTTISRSLPVQVPGLSGATALSAYSYTTCALAGAVSCWGFRDILNPSAFHPTTEFDTSPVPVAFPSNVSAICAGAVSNCALMDGAVYCWGDNYYGQLGNGTQTASKVPVKVDFSAYF